MKDLVDDNAGPWVVVIDGDTLVSDDWLDRLCGHAVRHRVAGIITTASSKAAASAQLPSRLWDECSVPEADRIAVQVNSGLCVDIPGVEGICTLITRNFPKAADCFNQASLGHGRRRRIHFS